MGTAIEGSRRLYEAQVAPMIREKFADYENRIAVGIAGEGSDCFGYDDYVSRDHDFGSGVVLWLTDDDMELFGHDLSDEYNKIIKDHPGNNLTARLTERRGVMTIRRFYNNILDADCYDESCNLSDEAWMSMDHNCLATAVNGEIFRDDLGAFTAFRNELLSYYPDRVWKIRIVDELHRFSQSMQVNYARCMSRNDSVAARMCQMNGLESAMQLFFLMKRVFPPYYKWTYRALTAIDTDGKYAKLIKELAESNGSDSMWDLEYDAEFINVSDPIVRTAERLAGRIVTMLREHNLTEGTNPYLETYVEEISRELRNI